MSRLHNVLALLSLLLLAAVPASAVMVRGEKDAAPSFAESGVFFNVADAPPVLMSSGEAAVWGHDLGMQDGPNVYAYVMQNPWTAFDPDGLKSLVYAHTPAEYQRLKKQEGKGLYHQAEIRKGYKENKDGSITKWRPTGTIFNNEENGMHLYDIGLEYKDASWVFDNATHASIIQHHHEMFGVYSAITGFSGLGRGMISRLPGAPAVGLRRPTKPTGTASPTATRIDDANQNQILMETPDGPPVRLEMGKQGKHIPDHNNYIPGRSPLTHKDPQSLLNTFAGKGQPANKVPRGQPGFKERVDFGEVIGIINGQPTTKGIVHYSKDGAHIVPANP